MPNITYTLHDRIATLTWDMQDSKVNTLSSTTLAEFERVLDEILASDQSTAMEALVVQSAKPGIFMQGPISKRLKGSVSQKTLMCLSSEPMTCLQRWKVWRC